MLAGIISIGLTLILFAQSSAWAIISGQTVSSQDPIAQTTVMIIGQESDGMGGNSYWNCTGEILADDIILTAGHCAPHGDLPYMRIVFGNYESPHETRQPLAVSKPDGSLSLDLALIIFKGGLPSGFHPMKVSSNRAESIPSPQIFAAGFGDHDLSGNGSGVLRKTELTGETYGDSHRFILSEPEKGGVCFGDSGGPAYAETESGPLLLGTLSFVSDTKEKKFCYHDAVYEDVSTFSSWIRDGITQLRKQI